MRYSKQNEKDHSIEENNTGEVDWQKWQTFYAVRRREAFQLILEALTRNMTPLK